VAALYASVWKLGVYTLYAQHGFVAALYAYVRKLGVYALNTQLYGLHHAFVEFVAYVLSSPGCCNHPSLSQNGQMYRNYGLGQSQSKLKLGNGLRGIFF